MYNNDLGKLRRSSVVLTNGPGSVVDFRADGAPVSAVVSGLDVWDVTFPPKGLINPQTISESRLERKLNVRGFRLPPVVDENYRDPKTDKPDDRHLRAYRFPEWLQCPQCEKVGPADRWQMDEGRAYRYCGACTAKSPGRRKVFAVPVRFVMACENGHLQDFPWHYWVGHREGCGNRNRFLKLRSEHPGLSGLILSCPECKAERSLDGIFLSDNWNGFRCSGRKPWLGDAEEECNKKPRVLQRGASNLYFPVTESALSIPPWSDRLQMALGDKFSELVNTAEADRAPYIRILNSNGSLTAVLQDLKLTPEELADRIRERINRISAAEVTDLRPEEYRQFISGEDTPEMEAQEFKVKNVKIPRVLQPFFNHIIRVERLREVRAIIGFTRINPPGDEPDRQYCQISQGHLPWLPAIEVRGEGIFIALNEGSLEEWEQIPAVQERAAKIDQRWKAEQAARFGSAHESRTITPRFLLIHTLAHALMRQLTLDCGYSGASLRERLYVSDGPGEMAGFLVYTSTSDSDGTLGGLQRQGEMERIERTTLAALSSMEWCSSDPLCIQGIVAVPESYSAAACHACVLAPETSCEEFNRFLDRATLVGTPEAPDTGYFHSLLRG